MSRRARMFNLIWTFQEKIFNVNENISKWLHLQCSDWKQGILFQLNSGAIDDVVEFVHGANVCE